LAKLAVYLRAINVGGRKLLMTDFKAALAKAGLQDVQTLGAAGTAVIEAMSSGAELEAEIEALLVADCGMASEVFVRDHAEMAAIVRGNPFAQQVKVRPASVAVSFLKRHAGAAEVEAVRERIAGFGGTEEIEVGPRCLYLSYPEGQGLSKLTPGVIERALNLRGTARNWNTVSKMTGLTR